VQQFPDFALQVMSSDKTPVLAGAVPSFERFMSVWEDLTKDNARCGTCNSSRLKMRIQILQTDGSYLGICCKYV
jgi:hypothetical protein